MAAARGGDQGAAAAGRGGACSGRPPAHAPALFRVEAAEVEVFGKRRSDVAGLEPAPPRRRPVPLPRAPRTSLRGTTTACWPCTGSPASPTCSPRRRCRRWPASAGCCGCGRRSRRRSCAATSGIIGTYAQAVSSALLNARLHREVADQATLKSFEAEHDALTGLANRALLLRRADEAIASDRRTGRSSALVLLDLDHFKHVNDTLGHAAGDALLRAVGHRLPPLLRHADTVARLGGDEFAVLLRDVESPASAMRRTRALLRTISEPLAVGSLEIAVHASAGIAVHPDDAADVDTLLQRADVAMYHAKRNRGTASQYDVSLEGNAGLQLAGDGRRAAAGARPRRARGLVPAAGRPGHAPGRRASRRSPAGSTRAAVWSGPTSSSRSPSSPGWSAS